MNVNRLINASYVVNDLLLNKLSLFKNGHEYRSARVLETIVKSNKHKLQSYDVYVVVIEEMENVLSPLQH